MNPAQLLRLKADLKNFRTAHPKFTSFFRYAGEHCLKEGNVVDISVRQPDGQEVHTNLRLSADDAQMLTNLLELLRSTGESVD